MSSSAVAELEAGLQSLLNLKPPGVSSSRVGSLTTLCVNNVKFESVLIQKLYTHFKKTPGTHKLGVLYIVDSVTRKWVEQAKLQGQAINMHAQDGSPAAAVHRVTELMPSLMNDIIATAPADQKDKIKKLIDIWEKAQTFSPSMVKSFWTKLNPTITGVSSTTPPGSPSPAVKALYSSGPKPASAPAPVQPPAMPNIMETLANIARQNASAAQSNQNVAAPAPLAAPHAPVPAYNGSNGVMQPQQQGMPFFPTSQPSAPPVSFQGLPPPFPQPGQPAPGPALAPVPAPASNAPNLLAATGQSVVQIIATLAAQGTSPDQIASLVRLMTQAQGAVVPQQVPPPLQQMPQPTPTGYAAPPAIPHMPGPAPWEMSRPDDTRDRNGYHDSMRSPVRARGRSRSRSPRGWDPRESPRTRNSRGFENGRPSSPGRGRPDERDRGRAGNMPDYRQRSPPRHNPHSPHAEPSQTEKWVEFDNSLPNGNIKVYSRTLFVGGVTCSEQELREIFERFGHVQTCIVNKDKRHAFVKMYRRKDAEAAKAAMEENRNGGGFGSPDLQLRTRWGVGFGPRDCSDYASGISVIPIHRLTDADRKWMLTAPYGGSGGRPIVTGMCVEEPDIEIGAGVSSKAISRRMQTDKGGNHGPKSTRRDDEPVNNIPVAGERGSGRWRQKRNSGVSDRRDERNDKAGNDEPVVLGLPPGFTVGRNGVSFVPGATPGSFTY